MDRSKKYDPIRSWVPIDFPLPALPPPLDFLVGRDAYRLRQVRPPTERGLQEHRESSPKSSRIGPSVQSQDRTKLTLDSPTDAFRSEAKPR